MITLVNKSQGVSSTTKFNEIVLETLTGFSVNIDIQQKHDFVKLVAVL